MSILIYKNFTKISDEEKDLVLEWRNQDRIRNVMDNKDVISKESHYKFIDGLKHRSDCSYNLLYIDDVAIGVTNTTNIDATDGSPTSGGIYIGNTDYLGYGIPIIYFDYKNIFENLKRDTTIFHVRKNNKRTFLMHQKIFKSKLSFETDDSWHMFLDKKTWLEVKPNLDDMVKNFFKITECKYI